MKIGDVVEYEGVRLVYAPKKGLSSCRGCYFENMICFSVSLCNGCEKGGFILAHTEETDASRDMVLGYGRVMISFKDVVLNAASQTPEEQVIFSGPATILVAPDGTKTIVKCSGGDTFDPKYGYLLAKFMQSSGFTRTQVAKKLREIERVAEAQLGKKSEPFDEDEFYAEIRREILG